MFENKSPWGSQPPRNKGRADTVHIDELKDKLLKKYKSDFNSPKNIFAALLVVVLIWLATGYYKVDVNEEGVEILLGSYNATKSSGLQWHMPYPLEKVKIVDVTSIRTEEIGYRTRSRFQYRAKQQSPSILEEALMLTGDENIVEIHAELQWMVKNSFDYLFNFRDQYNENTVKTAAESALREVIGKSKIASIMAEGRLEVEGYTKDLLQNILDQYNTGIEIVRVQLLKADPPNKVIDAYRDVQTAKADKESLINKAKAYANEVIPRAEGEAEKIILEAEAYYSASIAEAQGKANRFLEILKEYKKAKSVTEKRIYIDTMEKIMSTTNKVILDNVGKSGVLPYLPLNQLNSQLKAR